MQKIRNLLRKIINKLGYTIIRTTPRVAPLSQQTKELTLFKTKTGNYFLPTAAVYDGISSAIREGKIFDENIVNEAKQYISPNTSVLDVGSNFGQMAILFSNLTGDSGKVYAFDAADFVFEILQKNITANDKQNIIATFGAVHNVPNTHLFFPEPDFSKYGTYGSFGIDYKNSLGRKVPTITIDGLNIQEKISFMKVDVQGGDLYAMQGAIKTIARNQMPIVFEYEPLIDHDSQITFQDYVDFVAQINYRFVKVIDGQNYLILPK